jgi:hypothetical protein
MLLAYPEEGKIIILFTDGSSTLGNFIENSMKKSVDYVRENEVMVHAVGIGSESAPVGYLPEYYNISAVYNVKTLLYVTNQTGGTMVPSENEVDLEEAYLALLDAANDGLVSVKTSLVLLVAGLVLLFVEWGLISSRYRRIT